MHRRPSRRPPSAVVMSELSAPSALYPDTLLRAWPTVLATESSTPPSPPVVGAALARSAAAAVSGASPRQPAAVMSETFDATEWRSARPARLRARLVCGSVSSAVAVPASAHLAKSATLATRPLWPHRSPVGRCRRSSGWSSPALSSEPKRTARPSKRVANVSSVATSPVVVLSLALLRLLSALAPSARRALISVSLVKLCRSSSLLFCDDDVIPASHRRCTSPRGWLPFRFARSPLRSRGPRSRRALRTRCASKAAILSEMHSSSVPPSLESDSLSSPVYRPTSPSCPRQSSCSCSESEAS